MDEWVLGEIATLRPDIGKPGDGMAITTLLGPFVVTGYLPLQYPWMDGL